MRYAGGDNWGFGGQGQDTAEAMMVEVVKIYGPQDDP